MASINPKLLQAIIARLTGKTQKLRRGRMELGTERAAEQFSKGRQPVPSKGSTGPGPDPIDSPTPTESMGIAERRLNPFEQAAKEEGEAKRVGKSVFDDAPERLEQEIMEEVSGPRDRVRRQKRTTMDEMDNLFGDEEARQVEEIRAILDDPSTPQLSPALERETAKGLVSETVKLKEVDQAAKKVFSLIDELEGSLSLSGTSSQVERQQLNRSKKLLLNFKRIAAQEAEAARKTKDPSGLNSLLDRLSK